MQFHRLWAHWITSGRGCALRVFALLTLSAALAAPGHCQGTSASGVGEGSWTATGSLDIARAGHTATLLKDGRVLVAGGAAGTYTNTAEIYDPRTGAWTFTGSMIAPRAAHSATLLPDGRVLVVGGCDFLADPDHPDFSACNAGELYDPASGTWRLTARSTETHTFLKTLPLATGAVLVLDDLWTPARPELYDPTGDRWIPAAPFGGCCGPVHFATTSLSDGRPLIVGGSLDNDETPDNHLTHKIIAIASAKSYDSAADRWNSVGGLNTARGGHTATLLMSGSVLVAGGIDTPSFQGPTPVLAAEAFDAVTGTSLPAGSLHTGRSWHTATPLPGGGVLLVGGFADDRETLAAGAERFDPASGEWLLAAAPSTPRAGHTATRLQNGDVLVVGGTNSSTDSALQLALGRGDGSHPGAPGALRSAEIYRLGAAPDAAIGAGFTGTWFDPSQADQGFMLEVLPGAPMQMLATWFTFAPQGGASWIFGLGPISGGAVTIQGVQTGGSGARFPPSLDAANIAVLPWGTLTFNFSDCNHGHVAWVSTVPGYGSGGMDLTRLTLPAGLSCAD